MSSVTRGCPHGAEKTLSNVLGGTVTANLDADSVVPATGHHWAARCGSPAARISLHGWHVEKKKLSMKQVTAFSKVRADEIKMTEMNLHSDYWRKILSDSK